LDAALYDDERSGRPIDYDDHERSRIVAMVCTDPPKGWDGGLGLEGGTVGGVGPSIQVLGGSIGGGSGSDIQALGGSAGGLSGFCVVGGIAGGSGVGGIAELLFVLAGIGGGSTLPAVCNVVAVE
jgi:hypothetical protein